MIVHAYDHSKIISVHALHNHSYSPFSFEALQKTKLLSLAFQSRIALLDWADQT